MTHRFCLTGPHVRHSWQKECTDDDAIHYARLVAGEYGRDSTYDGAVIAVMDQDGNSVTTVPVLRRA